MGAGCMQSESMHRVDHSATSPGRVEGLVMVVSRWRPQEPPSHTQRKK